MPKAVKRAHSNVGVDKLDIARRMFFRLCQASNLMHKTGTSALNSFRTTTQQIAVLDALSAPEVQDTGLSVKELMEHLMVSRQSLTAILDRLENAQLIDRTRSNGDGRLRHIGLTQKGREQWLAMDTTVKAYYASAMADFSTEETYLLLQMLERLSESLAKL